MEQKRILLAENDPEDSLFIQNALKSAGYLVEAVEKGKEAEDLVQSGEYAAFFCNFALPDISGWKLMEKVFLDSELENTMVYAISNEPESRDVMGGHRYWLETIHKPLINNEKFEILLASLATYIERWQYAVKNFPKYQL